jgi:DNA recombination protein RmuC
MTRMNPDLSQDAVTLSIIAALAAGLLLTMLAALVWRARHVRRQREAAVEAAKEAAMADTLVQMTQAHSEAAARLEAMIGLIAKGQNQFQHTVNERLDSVSHRLGESLEKTKQSTAENLQKLNERLAVIDNAQKNITALASQVTSLQGVLANKQSRGAFGQWRMEGIVQDSLPKNGYEFQYTLSNKLRPDCAVFLPDGRPLVIDAKFPLEAVTAFKDAKSDDVRKAAAARVRGDIGRHIGDIAQKYLIPGETQDLALMFVPSESIYAELHDAFDDMVQKAFRAKVVIVSPSLLMIAIALVQQSQKDARMREAADQIRDELARLAKDVGLLGDRVRKLQTHFTQANEDIRQALISVEKIEARGERIREVDFDPAEAAGPNVITAPILRRLEAGE